MVALTAAEFKLLHTFLRSAGRVISREELFRDVLDREFSVFDRSIDNHVSSLRKKLGPQPGGPGPHSRRSQCGVRVPAFPKATAQDS